jgi:hypothetical protein
MIKFLIYANFQNGLHICNKYLGYFSISATSEAAYLHIYDKDKLPDFYMKIPSETAYLSTRKFWLLSNFPKNHIFPIKYDKFPAYLATHDR